VLDVHGLRQKDDDNDNRKRKKVAFEYPGVDTEKLLIQPSKTEPKA
jgi:hypothetical protein